MSKMMQLVEQMRARLNEIAGTEHSLVRALGEALSRVDQKLLQDVCNITTEHDARRVVLLHELQSLASRIGAFPTAREPVGGTEYAEPGAIPIERVNADQLAFGLGSWREAADNMLEELDVYFKGRTSSH
jgi:hypothetical protein